jgi:hypothetical protein
MTNKIIMVVFIVATLIFAEDTYDSLAFKYIDNLRRCEISFTDREHIWFDCENGSATVNKRNGYISVEYITDSFKWRLIESAGEFGVQTVDLYDVAITGWISFPKKTSLYLRFKQKFL